MTERLRDHFALPKDKDGPEWVNLVFGSKSTVPLPLDAAQKQAVDALIIQTRKAAHRDPKLNTPELYKATEDLVLRVHGEN